MLVFIFFCLVFLGVGLYLGYNLGWNRATAIIKTQQLADNQALCVEMMKKFNQKKEGGEDVKE